MSIAHHHESPEERAALETFLKQAQGDKTRAWPQGRISGEDDGETALLIASDPSNKTVFIRFPKPMDWIGLGINEAMQLRNLLDAKIAELSKP